MDSIIDKCKIIYKGDVIAGLIYFLIGILFIVFGLTSRYLNLSPGFTYLSIGFLLFSAYCIGKGIMIMLYSYRRMKIFDNTNHISAQLLDEEIAYTSYRIQKKHINRRVYTYMLVFFSVLSFVALFTAHKAVFTGTSIPIALISGIEFSIGILTEFRLKEFNRILNKFKNNRNVG